MINIYTVFVGLFMLWFFLTSKDLHDIVGITQSQRRGYDKAFNTIAFFFVVTLASEMILYTYMKEYIDKNIVIVLLVFINMTLVFLIKDGSIEDNKTIRAKQLSNFPNLDIKKVRNFKEYIKKETDTESNYYHFTARHKSNDMTVDSIELGEMTSVEFTNFFVKELAKEFKTHLVYKELIDYCNRRGGDYNIEPIEYEEFCNNYNGKKRFFAEFEIMKQFLKLKDKKIPIRIAQLLQYADIPYLSNYLYFIMSLESMKFTPNAILYAIFFIKKGALK